MKPLQAPRSLRIWFWLVVGALAAAELVGDRVDSVALLVAGNALAAIALLPAGLWCHGRAFGLPIFPLAAGVHLPAFAAPLITPTPEVAGYSVDARLAAAAAAMAFLAVGTLVWYPLASRPAVPRTYWAFRHGERNGLFLALVWFGNLFLILNNAGWLPSLPGGMYPVLRNASQGLGAIGAAVLAYRWGAGRLRRETIAGFLIAFAASLALSASGLMIVLALSNFGIVLAMFMLGRGKVPIGVLLVAFLIFSVLHAGKYRMRATYWGSGQALTPVDYPAYYGEWLSYGAETLVWTRGDGGAQAPSSLTDRASVLQMLLLVMDKSPDEKPFLLGETYALIPELMVPRFLLSDKTVSHEGTYRLSIYYGRQTREATRFTTIGFGHLSEAYANFGWPGVLGLGAVMGGLLGAVTRWSAGVPIDSFRGLFALYILGLSIQTEHTMGVTAASVSQGTLMLLALGWGLMETRQATEPK